jgi:hypothetical protein
MALNETITGDETSSSYLPSNTITNAIIESNGRGQVYVECQVPGGQWVGAGHEIGAFCMSTPDSAIKYRFRAVGVKEPVRVYFGP